MTNSNVTADSDKISFVRSNLKSGSRASKLMSATAFDSRLIKHDYSIFWRNFVEAFGLVQHHDSLQWIFMLAESLTSGFGSFAFLSTQAATSTITREAMEAVKKASWVENGQLSEPRLHSLLEVMIYVQFLSPTERRAASLISFSPDDLLLHCDTKIAKKLRESPKPSLATIDTPAPVAPIQNNPHCVSGGCEYTPNNGASCDAGGVPGTCADGGCVGLCDGVDCTSQSECVQDGSCDDQSGECVPGASEPADTACTEGGGSVCQQ